VSSGRLTHLDEQGRARMVDVSEKPVSDRAARARARLRMSPGAAAAVRDGSGPKGEVLAVARLAGVQAAKQTAQLIPLAHPLPLSFVDVEATVDPDEGIVELVAEARTSAGTGVEMEAMTAAAVAALTVYDMVKGIERGVEVEQVVLLEKRGGRSGHYVYDGDGAAPARAGAATDESGPPAAKSGAAVVTISTSKAAGRGEDESGPRLAMLAAELGLEVLASEVIPDDRARIEALLRTLSDERRCAVILTSGGTGVAPSDVTPQATRAVIDVEVEGLGEAMRAVSRPHTGNWMLSRALAGTRDGTLIVNLPGSPAAIEQIGAELIEPLRHAVALLAGGDGGHPPGGAASP
jgi:cyclic pyranopterin monophosphate synthase